MPRIPRCTALCTALLVALPGLPTAARANDTTLNVNVNPPRQLRHWGPPVRMAAEHITVRFGKEQSSVEVEFTFENLSDEDVYCTAGFPDEDLLVRWGYFSGPDAQGREPLDRFPGIDARGDVSATGLEDAGVLSGFSAWQRQAEAGSESNAPLETRLLRIERIAYAPELAGKLGGPWREAADSAANELMFCHVFDLNLAPRERRVIGHRYTTRNGSNVEGQRLFSYTLATGSTWAGTIGEALIDLYLEDGLSLADLKFREHPDEYYAACHPAHDGWQQLDATHLQARWTDFEPEGARAYIMLATQPRPYEQLIQDAGAGS